MLSFFVNETTNNLLCWVFFNDEAAAHNNSLAVFSSTKKLKITTCKQFSLAVFLFVHYIVFWGFPMISNFISAAQVSIFRLPGHYHTRSFFCVWSHSCLRVITHRNCLLCDITHTHTSRCEHIRKKASHIVLSVFLCVLMFSLVSLVCFLVFWGSRMISKCFCSAAQVSISRLPGHDSATTQAINLSLEIKCLFIWLRIKVFYVF